MGSRLTATTVSVHWDAVSLMIVTLMKLIVALSDRVWNATIPVQASKSLQVFVYGMMMTNHRHHPYPPPHQHRPDHLAQYHHPSLKVICLPDHSVRAQTCAPPECVIKLDYCTQILVYQIVVALLLQMAVAGVVVRAAGQTPNLHMLVWPVHLGTVGATQTLEIQMNMGLIATP